ncbi:MAG: hypothetical protein Q9165_006532 [Trypethelium subeluteriae]
MAEIIGVLATSAQLAVYAIQAKDCCMSFIEKVRDGPRLEEDLSSQVNDMIDIVQSIKAGSLEKQTQNIMDRCDSKLARLAKRLGKLRSCRNGMVGRTSLALTLATNQKTIENLINDILKEFCLLQTLYIVQGTGTENIRHDQVMQHIGTWITMPPPNVLFVGHTEDIERVKRKVNPLGSHTRIAIVGLGGIGKSELAIEAAYRLKRDVPGLRVLFVRAGSELEFETSYLEAAKAEDIINQTGYSDPIKGFRGIKSFFDSEASGKWLIIIDGADMKETFFGPRQTFDLLPHGRNGSIIFTSRNNNLAFQLVRSNPESLISLGPLAEKDAVELLTRISNDHESDEASRVCLANELEYLPLALVHAATYVLHAQIGIRGYLNLYYENETERLDLLGDDLPFKDPVTRTWLITFEQIQKDNALAEHLFSFMACLHYHEIPYRLLPMENVSRAKAFSALSLLKAYSMIQLDQDKELLNVHRLVHLVLRHQLKTKLRFTKYAQMALNAVTQEFPPNFKDGSQLSIGRSLILHAQTTLKNSEDLDIKSTQLNSQISLYLRVTGNYVGSLQHAALSHERLKVLKGEDSENTLETLSELAVVYEYLDNYQESERITSEVLSKRREILGDEHPDVLASWNNLGLILEKQGRYQEAEDIHRGAFKVKERLLGPSHDDSLKSKNNLGRALQEQGKYQEAEACFQTVVDARRELYGEMHTGRLLSLNNLGLVFQQQGKLAEAFEIHSMVFCTREQLLGPKHPDTLRSKSNVALVLMGQENYSEAEVNIRQVLRDMTEMLGKTHLETVTARRNLAAILHRKGNLVEAEKLYIGVFEARKTHLGPDHPKTKSCAELIEQIRVDLDQIREQDPQEEVV